MLPSSASGIRRRMPLPRPTRGLELEDRLDRVGAGAHHLARRPAVGIDRKAAWRGARGACLQLVQDRVGAVDGLDVPAQRQHVAPIAVGMKQRVRADRRRAAPALPRIAPANCRRQPKYRRSCRACAFLVTGRLRGVFPFRSLYPFGRRRKAVTRCRLFRQRQDMPLFRRHAAVEGIEIGRAHRGRPAAFDHLEPLLEFRGKAGPGRRRTVCRRRPVPTPSHVCGSGRGRRTRPASRPAVPARPARSCDG